MRLLLRRFDALARRILGVVEFSRDLDCLLRLRSARLRRPLELDGASYPAGTPVLELHVWNERVPVMPPDGADLAWAADAGRRLRRSLHLLAAHIESEGRAAPLIRADTVLASDPGAEALFRRLGFVLRSSRRRPGAILEVWENAYALALMAAFNPPSARRRSLRSLRRTELWMSTDVLLKRYGAGGRGTDP